MFGFRLWKVTSGIIGFLFGFFFLFFLVHYVMHSHHNNVWIGLGAGIGMGLVLGILLFLFPVLSLIVLSLFCGLVAGLLLYDVALVYIHWKYIYYVTLVIFAFVFLILGLCIKRAFLIFMTSMYGSFAIAYGIATFAGGFPIFVDPSSTNVRPPNYWLVYVYFGAIIAGTILGVILQYRIFARGLLWEDVNSRICPRKGLQDDRLGTPLMEMDGRDSSGSDRSSKKKKKKLFGRSNSKKKYDGSY